jgi:hypothetical protein
VPAASINCYVYCLVHPNLSVTSAGLFIYEGVKPYHLAAELFDMPVFMSGEVAGDGRDIQLPNGLRMQVIDPLEHIHMTYSDPVRATEVDVHMKAIAPPIMRANSKHFEQIMHTTGRLVLRGREYEVDNYHVRDRSWGELRPESHNPGPPYTWVTGVVEDGSLAFNVGANDDPTLKPHWSDAYDITPEQAFKDGWVWRDGRALRLARASKQTVREPGSLRPTEHVIELEDVEGQSLRILGEVVASLPWGSRNNNMSHLGLVRWTVGDRIAWGDSMDVQWNDYVWRYARA